MIRQLPSSRHTHLLARRFSPSSLSSRIPPHPTHFPTFLRNSDSPHKKPVTPPIAEDSHLAKLCSEGQFHGAFNLLHRRRGLVDDAIALLDNLPKSQLPKAYPPLLQLCLRHAAVDAAGHVYNRAVSSGYRPEIPLSNRLISFFSRSGLHNESRKVFDSMPVRDACSWNTIISCYAKRGDMGEARYLFDEMPTGIKDDFSWSSMMAGFVRHGRPAEALMVYREMQVDGRLPGNKFTISSALAASAAAPSLRSGKEIHAHVLRRELDSDAVLWSALSDMYAKCGSLAEARQIFNFTPGKDVVSWSAMIGRYVEAGRSEEGLGLFASMLNSGVQPNEFTFAAVLSLCSEKTMEYRGKEIHGKMVRMNCDPASFAGGALIDMYSKCSNLSSAKAVFERMPSPDLVSWTSLISGFAQHGFAMEALRYYDLLLSSGLTPDHVVFVGALSACTHAGFVDRGLEIFFSIEEEHGLAHTSDHYACVVDLLSRAGRFDKAEEIIGQMKMKPDKFLWASLLGGCRIHGNLRLAHRAAEALFRLEPTNAANYVTLANIFAVAGLWEEVVSTRRLMEARGAIKVPGSSWIEVQRKVHRFLVGDDSHPRIKDIHVQLEKLSAKMKEEGYVPNTTFVLHDVEEEQKEEDLVYHSEKLAVAFGIIATPPGAAIKVFKNLRICGDCHTAMKFISRIVQRKIIVRDSSRFHHFIDGKCTCGDYW
ncbi:pentatricopeptide repeat (PPR) superfamily protein [Wolffia australiana]